MNSATETENTMNEVQPLPEWQYYPEDFIPSDDIMSDDDDRIHRLKEIICRELTVGEREIWLLYTHNDANYHEAARLLGCSISTARKRIIMIRNKILKLYDTDRN